MTPDPTLTDEELAKWTSLHQRAGEAEGTYCECCRRWWPCPEAKLIAALRAIRSEVERLREDARENYARAERAEQELVATRAELAQAVAK